MNEEIVSILVQVPGMAILGFIAWIVLKQHKRHEMLHERMIEIMTRVEEELEDLQRSK